jgi:pimeloyl-ACP methyl ester carboxylesterase
MATQTIARPVKRPATKTPPFPGPDGEVLPGGIAEVAYSRLGGLDQWVLIRGESIANPPLILLHGGPGLSETRFFRRFNAPLEKSFTVVYWDQRGAGESFYPDIPRSSMTVEQFISDLDDLVEVVCERLGKTKVVIFGHSWGSALGALYAARFPEKVAAYAGSGQYGDAAAGEAGSYASSGSSRPPGASPRCAPSSADRRCRAAGRSRGACSASWAWSDLVPIALGVPESSIFDLPRIMRGFRFSLDAMRVARGHIRHPPDGGFARLNRYPRARLRAAVLDVGALAAIYGREVVVGADDDS